jgi:hypothetical protein
MKMALSELMEGDPQLESEEVPSYQQELESRGLVLVNYPRPEMSWWLVLTACT